jgi:hypothetical protein
MEQIWPAIWQVYGRHTADTSHIQGSYKSDTAQICAGIVQLLRKIVVMTRASVYGAKIYPKDAQKSGLIRKKYRHNSV